MNRIFTLTLVAAVLSTGMVSAQTRQAADLGASGNDAYPVRVQGQNGTVYVCSDQIQVVNGASVRQCIVEGGSLFSSGNGLAAGAAVAGGAVLLAVIAGASDSSTTTTTSSVAVSDMRLKTDINWIGTTVHDLPLYSFRYTDQSDLYEGVMAQDVLDVMPDAVSKLDSGFMAVDYGILGLEMRRVD